MIDNILDLTKYFLNNLGETTNQIREKCASQKTKNSIFTPGENEKIVDLAIKKTGISDDGIEGLETWYRDYVINRYTNHELNIVETNQNTISKNRRGSLKGKNQSSDKDQNVSEKIVYLK